MGGIQISTAGRLGALVVGLTLGIAACQPQQAPPPPPSPEPVVVVEQVVPTETPVPAPTETPTPRATDTPAATATTTPTSTPAVPPTATPHPAMRTAKKGEWTIEIPRIDVVAPVVTVGWDPDGAIGSPNDPDVVGWFKGGAYPGKDGNAIFGGHYDWAVGPRPAIFWDLNKVAKGAYVFIYDDGEAYAYQVTRNVSYRFDDPDAEEVIQPSDEPIITLITCGGTFDPVTKNYTLRTIVQAKLVGSY